MPKIPELLVLGGGLGTRLWNITEGTIPKCEIPIRHDIRGIDILMQGLLRICMDATFSADRYFYHYAGFLSGTSHRLLWQKPGGTVEAVLQTGNTVLSITPDCIFDATEISRMVAAHIPGTITWAVTKNKMPMMDQYIGMDLVGNAIVGRTNREIIRSPLMILEPEIIKQFRAPSDRPEGEDLFSDVMPRIEQENARRVKEKKPSILNAFLLDSPILDFGTPERLKLATEVLDEIVRL